MCHGKETKTIMEGASLMALAHGQQKGHSVSKGAGSELVLEERWPL